MWIYTCVNYVYIIIYVYVTGFQKIYNYLSWDIIFSYFFFIHNMEAICNIKFRKNTEKKRNNKKEIIICFSHSWTSGLYILLIYLSMNPLISWGWWWWSRHILFTLPQKTSGSAGSDPVLPEVFEGEWATKNALWGSKYRPIHGTTWAQARAHAGHEQGTVCRLSPPGFLRHVLWCLGDFVYDQAPWSAIVKKPLRES